MTGRQLPLDLSDTFGSRTTVQTGTATMPAWVSSSSIAQRLLPALSWLLAYRRDWLLSDVMAGLAVWAVMVPAGMAYAGIVGVPSIIGLHTIITPMLALSLPVYSRC